MVTEQSRNALFNFPELFGMCDVKTTTQLHWQNRSNLRETRLVEQSQPCGSFQEAEAWTASLVKYEGQCPEGWMPMVCTQDSQHFVRGTQLPTARAG